MSVPLEIPLIQVAGIRDRAEAVLLQECGIRYLGFPLRLPVNRADLTEPEAADIIRSLQPPPRGVLITYLNEAGAIADFCRAMGARMVQLHGDIARAELERLRELDPGLTIIKSLVVGLHSASVLERLAVELAPLVDGFITDTYAPQTGASGATGLTHDWAVSRRLVQVSPKPVILAGGLTPTNVGRPSMRFDRPASTSTLASRTRTDGKIASRCWPSWRSRRQASLRLKASGASAQGRSDSSDRSDEPGVRVKQVEEVRTHHRAACIGGVHRGDGSRRAGADVADLRPRGELMSFGSVAAARDTLIVEGSEGEARAVIRWSPELPPPATW